MENDFALVGVKVDPDRCTHCGTCVMSCGMDVRHVGDHECINCAKCMDVCRQDAISLKAGKITLKAPEGGCADDKPDSSEKRAKAGRIAWGVALIVLAFALLWYNMLDKTGDAASVSGTDKIADQLEVQNSGNQPGEKLPDFTIECTDETQFHLADSRDKVTFINLWATYCGPCVKELPYFNDLAAAHEGDVEVLAVHSSLSKDDIAEYLSDKGWDNILFAKDTADKLVWDIVGGSSTIPQTIVLDRNGTVIYNHVGSVTPELLESLYSQASAE